MAVQFVDSGSGAGHTGPWADDSDWASNYAYFTPGIAIDLSEHCIDIFKSYGMPGGPRDRQNSIVPDGKPQEGPFMRHLMFTFRSSAQIKRRGIRYEELTDMHRTVHATKWPVLLQYLRTRFCAQLTRDTIISEDDMAAILLAPALLFEHVFFGGVGAENSTDGDQTLQWGLTKTFNVWCTSLQPTLAIGSQLVLFVVIERDSAQVADLAAAIPAAVNQVLDQPDLCGRVQHNGHTFWTSYAQIYPGVIIANEARLTARPRLNTPVNRPPTLSTHHQEVVCLPIGQTTQRCGYMSPDIIQRYLAGEFNPPQKQRPAAAPRDKSLQLEACEVHLQPGKCLYTLPISNIVWNDDRP